MFNPFNAFKNNDLDKDISILENIITKTHWAAQIRYVNLALFTAQHIQSSNLKSEYLGDLIRALATLQKHYDPSLANTVENIIKNLSGFKTGKETKIDISNWIYVPSIKLHVSREVTCKGMNWNECQGEAAKNGCRMLTPYQFFEFIKHLQKTNETELLNSILERRGLWRGEFLDAYFDEGKMYTNNRTKSQKLASNIIKEDCYVDLDSINENGLPTKKSATQKYIQNKNIFYYCPRNGRIAFFYCDDDDARLVCDGRYPDYRGFDFEVRFAKP